VRFNRRVNLGHEADGCGEGGDGAAVVREVVEGERARFAILEPLARDLIAADVEVPDFGCDARKILRAVDPVRT